MDVSIIIPTFLRPDYLRNCLIGIHANLPGCEVIVISDDDLDPVGPFHEFVTLPFDSGITAKRNAGFEISSSKYSVLGSDDFNFDSVAREGIKKFVDVLEAHPDIDVVVGRYNNRDYQGFLTLNPPEYIMETSLDMTTPPLTRTPYPVWKIDIGINYLMARTQFLRDNPWDILLYPIGGEHGDWFIQLKQKGATVVFLPEAHISNIEGPRHWTTPLYSKMRARARIGHQMMLKKYGIKKYIGFNEARP